MKNNINVYLKIISFSTEPTVVFSKYYFTRARRLYAGVWHVRDMIRLDRVGRCEMMNR